MNVLVCSERFLFRFGADRVLLLLAQHLKGLGHRVALAGSHFDADSRALFGSQIVVIPGSDDYLHLNEQTAEWLTAGWDSLCDAVGTPDLAIVGGWPFFAALPLLRERCASLVMDFGAVPLDGYSSEQVIVQQKLRSLRVRHLPAASMIVAISQFIADTQSIPEAAGVPVRTLLLGADHIESQMWRGGSAPGAGARRAAQLRADGCPVLLNLGRWEPGCYKNSEAAFDLMREVCDRHSRAVLLVLADAAEVSVPLDLRNVVLPIGRPGDLELKEIMRGTDLGVTLSRWEGFNLPLAEMQWLGRRVLALDAGAHREVIVDPGSLCHSPSEMAAKVNDILSGPSSERELAPHALATFRSRFGWNRVFREFRGLVQELVGAEKARSPVRIVMDVTSSTRDPANSGVIRVTRRLGRALQEIAAPVFVVWEPDRQRYVFPTAAEFLQLGQFNGPVRTASTPLSAPDRRIPLSEVLELQGRGAGGWFLISETVPGSRIGAAHALARDSGMRLAAVFYDAIPVLYPDLCPDPLIRENHAGYMRELGRCDVVFPISAFSARCLREFWEGAGVVGGDVIANVLPGEFGDGARALEVDAAGSSEIRILCVSTLEPRKNQLGLARAFLQAAPQCPTLTWSLTFVGNRYAGAFHIAGSACRSWRASGTVARASAPVTG
jgi:glycosyltransferase involved in cell wall biosynthesis